MDLNSHFKSQDSELVVYHMSPNPGGRTEQSNGTVAVKRPLCFSADPRTSWLFAADGKMTD